MARLLVSCHDKSSIQVAFPAPAVPMFLSSFWNDLRLSQKHLCSLDLIPYCAAFQFVSASPFLPVSTTQVILIIPDSEGGLVAFVF